MNIYKQLINEVLLSEGIRSAKQKYGKYVCDAFIKKVADLYDPSPTKKYVE